MRMGGQGYELATAVESGSVAIGQGLVEGVGASFSWKECLRGVIPADLMPGWCRVCSLLALALGGLQNPCQPSGLERVY